MKNETKSEPKHEPKTEPLLGSVGGRRELSWRERRALGLTFLNLLATARELKVAGEIDSSTLSSDMAAAIAMRMEQKSPSTFAALGPVDWDAIIAFIERLIPLIAKLIELFAKK